MLHSGDTGRWEHHGHKMRLILRTEQEVDGGHGNSYQPFEDENVTPNSIA